MRILQERIAGDVLPESGERSRRMKKKKKSGTLGTIIFLIILAAVIFGCFFTAQRKAKERAEEQIQQEARQTEAEKLIMMDINQKYPVTAREVVKLYNRILQCVHNDDVTDAEVKALAGQFRCLYDEEFLQDNPYDQHVDDLILEVAEYDMLDRTISRCEIEGADSMAEWENDKGRFASLNVKYTLKEADQVGQISEKFLLRKQDDGRWKILGWEKIDNSEVEK